MKKRLGIYLIILLVFSLTSSGCGIKPGKSTGTLQVNEQKNQSENEGKSIQNTDEQKTDEQVLKASDNLAEEEVGNNHMKLKIGEHIFSATLVDNSSVKALKEILKKGPITIDMQDYANMEKVGPLGTNLPRNDEQITTKPGDLILYQGNALVIYYAPNSWNFTRIGKIDDVTQAELKEALGNGNVKVILSLE